MKRALLLAATIFVLAAPPALAGGPAETTLKLKRGIQDSGAETYQVRGTISSPRAQCAEGRRVFLYMGSTENRIGSAIAERQGDRVVWVVENSGFAMAGEYFARVEATNRCRAARSNTYLWA